MWASARAHYVDTYGSHFDGQLSVHSRPTFNFNLPAKWNGKDSISLIVRNSCAANALEQHDLLHAVSPYCYTWNGKRQLPTPSPNLSKGLLLFRSLTKIESISIWINKVRSVPHFVILVFDSLPHSVILFPFLALSVSSDPQRRHKCEDCSSEYFPSRCTLFFLSITGCSNRKGVITRNILIFLDPAVSPFHNFFHFFEGEFSPVSTICGSCVYFPGKFNLSRYLDNLHCIQLLCSWHCRLQC